jgi:nicotinamidase-related amidase
MHRLWLAALCSFLLIAGASSAATTRAQTPAPTATGTAAAAQGQALQLPTLPDPVPVQLDASKTAFLVLDMVDRICNPDPRCLADVPNIASGLAAARAAGVFVAYSTSPPANILPDLAPAADDPIVSAHADKFYGNNLDDLLKAAGATTLVITGTGTGGAVLYTSFAANERGYTVVVPVDAAVSHSDFQALYASYQMLNQPSFSNPTNTPLKPTAITLSRTDQISYK